MSANIAKTILPGEHGFHTRDGSLTKRKLEQWEKEKAESLQWFPFGASQARTSRRSREPERSRPQTDSSSAVVKESLNTSSEAENISSQIAQAQDVINGNNVNLVAQNQAGHFASLPTSFHASYASVGQLSSQPTPMPYQVPLSGDNHNSYAAPFVYNQLANPYIQHFPGLVPIFPSLYPHVTTTAVIDNAHSSSNDVNMAPPQHQPLLISTADQWNYSNQQKQYHMMQNMAGSFYVSSACSNDEDLVDNQHYSHGNNELARSPLPSLPEDRHELVRMNKAELDEQLMEKRRLEEAILEEEKRETEHLKKIHEEQERRQEQESAGEVNKWKKRQEALDANEKAFMEKLEKAKFESEVLRKAKRFKHILLHSETTQKKIGEVLGTNDRELIRRVLNELGALERQKRLEMENLSASHVSATCGGGGGAVGSLNSTVSSRPASTSGVTPSSSQRGVGSDGGLSASLSASQEPKRSILKNGCGAGSKNVASVTGHGRHTEITPLTRGFSMRSSFRPIGSRKYVEVTEALKRRSGSDERLNALTDNGKNSTNTYTSNVSPLQQRRDRIESVRSSTSHTSPANAYNQSPSLQKVNSSPKNIINSSCNKSDSNKPVQVPPSSVQQPPRPVPPPRRCLTQQNQQQPLNPTASSSSVNSSHTVVIDDGRDSPQYSQMAGKGLPTVTLDYSSNSRSFAPMNGNSNNGRKPAIPPKPANIHLPNKVSVSSRVNGETLTSKNRKNCVSSKKEDSRVNSEELIVEPDQYNRQEETESSNNHQEASVLCVNTGVQCDAANSLFSIEQHLRHLNRAFTAVANAPPVVMTRRLVGPNVSSAKRYLNELPATLDNNEGSSKASSSSSNGRHIGLFEPVITRQRMSCQADRHHRQMADFQKGSTVSASTSSESATDASTSSVSSSPVLSAGCKSSSPVFVNRNHMAEEGGCSSASSNHSGEVSQICREFGTSESGLQQMSSKFKALLTTPSRSREDVTGGYGSSNGGRLRNGGAARMEKLPPSPFSQKLAETAGNFRRPIPDHLANHPADILRRSLRSPTMMRLQESLGNISVVANDVNNVKTNGDADENSRDEYDDPSGSVTSSRCGTPKPFNCRTAQYRSFNLKRSGATTAAGGTERQRRILDQLASVRAQLKNRQENIKRTMSNHNIAGMTSVTGCNGVGPTLSNGGQKQ